MEEEASLDKNETRSPKSSSAVSTPENPSLKKSNTAAKERARRKREAWTRRMRVVIKWGERFVPEFTAAWLEWLAFRPDRFRMPNSERELLASGTLKVETVGRQRIATWYWQRRSNDPWVILLHGWAGRAGQMTSFVNPLLDAGFSVFAFDAPGHGLSAGRSSSGPEFAEALKVLSERLPNVRAVIAHSLGGWAAGYAIFNGAPIERAVLIGAPITPTFFMNDIARELEFPDGLLARVIARSERKLGLTWAEVDLTDKLNQIRADGMIVHDHKDRDVPVSNVKEYERGWKNCTILLTEGLGHIRVLRDPVVIRQVVAYLSSSK